MRTQEAESGGKGSVGTGKQEAGSRKQEAWRSIKE